MELLLQRQKSNSKCTYGSLYMDGNFECYTLEDIVRVFDKSLPNNGKIAGQTAIPAGRYKVILDWSKRFVRVMPHILAVPYFEGVRLHKGNTDSQTEGCILLGKEITGTDWLGHSKDAFDPFFEKLKIVVAEGKEIWIEIKDAA
jgi:hypothetical protein